MCTQRWKPCDPRRKRRTTESWRLAVRLVELAVVKLENFQVRKGEERQVCGAGHAASECRSGPLWNIFAPRRREKKATATRFKKQV